jgi:hypothetical protein
MSELRYPEWRNENDHGKYPFALGATMTNGDLMIPDNLFADARIYPIGGTQNQFLSKITKTDTGVTFHVSDDVNGELATGTYSVSAPSERGAVQLSDLYGRAAGVLVTDAARMVPLLGWVSGEYEFTADQAPFVCGVIVPMPLGLGVRSLRVDDTSYESVSGDVFIVGGRGVVLESAREGDDIVITVHAVGEPLYKQLLCAGLTIDNPCGIKTINGIKPDPYGNYQIVPCCLETAKPVIRVEPVENGIKILTIGNV